MAPEQADGRDQDDRPGRRRLRPGGHPLRAADRPAAVPRRRRRWTRCSRCVARSRCRRRSLQPKLPRDLETICLKCLQKEPRQALRHGRGPGRRPAALPGRRADPGPAGGPGGAPGRWCKRNPRVAVLSGTVAGWSWSGRSPASVLAWQLKQQKAEANPGPGRPGKHQPRPRKRTRSPGNGSAGQEERRGGETAFREDCRRHGCRCRTVPEPPAKQRLAARNSPEIRQLRGGPVRAVPAGAGEHGPGDEAE